MSKTKQKKNNKVEVDRKAIENLQKEIKKLKNNNDMLLKVADKKRLAQYYARHKKNLPNVVKLRLWGGKVVLGWHLTKDIVERDPDTNRWREDQKIELLFEDGSKKKIHYVTFVRRYTTTPAKVTGEIEDKENGQTALKVVRKDNGKEYTIGVQYVN